MARVEVRRRAAAEIWLWPGLPVPATRALRDVLPPISLPTPLTTAALLAAIDAAAMRVGAA